MRHYMMTYISFISLVFLNEFHDTEHSVYHFLERTQFCAPTRVLSPVHDRAATAPRPTRPRTGEWRDEVSGKTLPLLLPLLASVLLRQLVRISALLARTRLPRRRTRSSRSFSPRGRHGSCWGKVGVGVFGLFPLWIKNSWLERGLSPAVMPIWMSEAGGRGRGAAQYGRQPWARLQRHRPLLRYPTPLPLRKEGARA